MPARTRCQIKEDTMLIHWKSLIGFGVLFWFLLCATDLFGGRPRGYFYSAEDYDLLYETIIMERLERSESAMMKLRDFGAFLILWNLITFVCSLILCQLAKSCWWLLFHTKFKRTFWSYSSLNLNSNSMRSITPCASKIPIKIKAAPLTNFQVSDLKKRLSFHSEVSCPNFFRERTRSTLSDDTARTSPKFRTLFRNKVFAPTAEEPYEHLMDTRQITRLRAEIIKLQSKCQKDQSELTRRIDTICREKKDVTRQLSMLQKENRAAKQQIEELAQEKAVLLRKLECATKDIKSNTKSKKAALTKLEELTLSSEKLKQELEQVSRDKDILENKLKVLQIEYEKLQERIILPAEVSEDYHVNTPERDTNKSDNNHDKDKSENNRTVMICNHNMNIEQQSVSQTELDMKNIQVKIKQLERNLESFNSKKSDFTMQRTEDADSDLNLNVSDRKQIYEGESDPYEFFFGSVSPRLGYWTGRAGDVVSVRPSCIVFDTNSQSPSAIQTIANKVNEKVRLLDNIRERCETEIDEYSSHESLEDLRTPRRIVSSSAAFQNFLKHLSPEGCRLPYDSQSECCF